MRIRPTAAARRRSHAVAFTWAWLVPIAVLSTCVAQASRARAAPSPPLNAVPTNRSPAEIGRPRPALEVDDLDGNLINDLRLSGRMLVVVFFATWCQPCHRAIADVLAARALVGLPDLDLVLIDFGESEAEVKGWAVRAKLPAGVTVALDPNATAAHRWGARRLPTTFIMDVDGIVRHINRGWGAGYRDRISGWLRALPRPIPGASPMRQVP